MQNPDVQHLLEKYRTGTISPEELALLEAWYLQWQPENQDISLEELQAIKADVWQLVKPPARVIKTRSWPRIAAAASLLLLFAASAYYLLHQPTQQSKQEQVAASPVHDFKPGGNKALLTLANGQQIVLTDVKNGKLADQGSVTVNKTANGQLVYGAGTGNASANMIYNTLATPRGGQYHITLSDGTQVWMNAASSITYPVTFANNERKVVVNGEVYFEVAPDVNKPFKVSTGNQEVMVLGTRFNVNGYADDAGISTTLLSGSIKVRNLTSGQSSLLVPGQQASIFKNQAPIHIKTVNAEDAISWKNGYFLFDNQDISSVMKIMSRWYDVDIEYSNYNRQDRFGGTFSRSANLSEILHNLEQVGPVHFKMQANKVIVTN
ncbi:FecR family protein [Chitinophaga sp. GbtcB8]|uniref:FecR family protein n=1 Tax=Chitinophaga sp. GbtcB8 TaxID=2824753 RepID=UPI001C2F6BBA|nr:FecR domain-containing protein [Chitinophaga sp. GbtcB8]